MAPQESIHKGIQTRDLIDQCEIIKTYLWINLFLWKVHEYFWALFLKVYNEIFKLFLVDFKVLHDHVVTQAIPFFPELPVVHVMVKGLLIKSVQINAIPIRIAISN